MAVGKKIVIYYLFIFLPPAVRLHYTTTTPPPPPKPPLPAPRPLKNLFCRGQILLALKSFIVIMHFFWYGTKICLKNKTSWESKTFQGSHWPVMISWVSSHSELSRCVQSMWFECGCFAVSEEDNSSHYAGDRCRREQEIKK